MAQAKRISDLPAISSVSNGDYFPLNKLSDNSTYRATLDQLRTSLSTGSFSGSLTGTATNAITSSFAVNSALAALANTASYVLNGVSSSFANSASFSTISVNSSTASLAVLSINSNTASLAVTASYVAGLSGSTFISSSFANSASYATPRLVKNIKDFGAVGNGSTDDSAALINALASTTLGLQVYIPYGTYKISNNVLVDDSRTLLMDRYANFSIDTGISMSIKGTIQGDMTTKFTGNGSASFYYTSMNEKIPVTWFGADPSYNNSGYNSTVAFQKAIDAAAWHHPIYVPTGTYGVNKLTFGNPGTNRTTMKGDGFSKSTILFMNTSSASDLVCFDLLDGLDRVEFHGFALYSNVQGTGSARTIGMRFGMQCSEIYFYDVDFTKWNKYAVQLNGSPYAYFDRCKFQYNRNDYEYGGDRTNYAVSVTTMESSSGYISAANFNRVRFTDIDSAVNLKAGVINFSNCSIEGCGSGSNPRTSTANIMHFSSSNIVQIDSLYTERNPTATDKYIIYTENTYAVRLNQCGFGNENGGSTTTFRDVKFGPKTYGSIIQSCGFQANSNCTWVAVDPLAQSTVLNNCTFADNSGVLINNLTTIKASLSGSDKIAFNTTGSDISVTPRTIQIYSPTGSAASSSILVHTYTTKNLAGSVTSAGFGSKILFNADRSDGFEDSIGSIESVWTNPVSGNQRSAIVFSVQDGLGSGNLTSSMTLDADGTLATNGIGLRHRTVTAASNFFLNSDGVMLINTGSSLAYLPNIGNPTARGKLATFKLITPGTCSIFSPNGSVAIEGSLTLPYVLTRVNDAVTFGYDGASNWRVISSNVTSSYALSSSYGIASATSISSSFASTISPTAVFPFTGIAAVTGSTVTYTNPAGGAAPITLQTIKVDSSVAPSVGFGFRKSILGARSDLSVGALGITDFTWEATTPGTERSAMSVFLSGVRSGSSVTPQCLRVDGYGNVSASGYCTAVKTITTSSAGVNGTLGSYVVQYEDSSIFVTATGFTGSNAVVTLPLTVVVPIGRTYTVKLITSGSVLITGSNSGANIDSAPSFTLTAQNKYVTLQSTGTQWYVIANN